MSNSGIPWNSPGQNTRVGCLSLLQGIFPTQGSNPGLPHCRQVLYQLSHKGSPRTLEGVAYPFSRGSSLTQESNHGHLHCRWILYQLSYQGSPDDSLASPLILTTKCMVCGTNSVQKCVYMWFLGQWEVSLGLWTLLPSSPVSPLCGTFHYLLLLGLP